MNYDRKKFKVMETSANGEVSPEVIFEYRQEGQVLSCDYAGGDIVTGHLIGLVDEQGVIDMRYHQVNTHGILMTGRCLSTPEVGEDGKITLYEDWTWTSGDGSSGQSILREV